MIFNKHSRLEGAHAFLSPSSYHWVNYDSEKLSERFLTAMAAKRGTELHEFAHDAIRLGIKLPKNKNTMNLFVNDALGFRMETEQVLYYSDNCFGTADAISFRRNKLRIHDLKTGVHPASMKQLEVYAAIFCLEYDYKPFDIEMELRIYQSDEVQVHIPEPEEISRIMGQIISMDKLLNELKEEM